MTSIRATSPITSKSPIGNLSVTGTRLWLNRGPTPCSRAHRCLTMMPMAISLASTTPARKSNPTSLRCVNHRPRSRPLLADPAPLVETPASSADDLEAERARKKAPGVHTPYLLLLISYQQSEVKSEKRNCPLTPHPSREEGEMGGGGRTFSTTKRSYSTSASRSCPSCVGCSTSS